MKKILIIMTMICILLAFVGCAGTEIIENEEPPITESATNTTETEKIEWKEFLQEYEAWVDKYIELTKKYKDNPSDMSILSDYTDMLSELTEWTDKTTELQKDLEKASPSEVAEYAKELSRIAAKLAKVSF